MTEMQKMIAGELFDPFDAELTEARDRATRLMHRLNVVCCGHDEQYLATLRELCPNVRCLIREPFHCDYGFNIHIGERSFVNFDCVFLDLAPIRIGHHTLIGPKVQLLTAEHPINPHERASGHEAGRPITIGNNCWLGGGVIVCPGVTIGDRAIIGAGAVVTHDIPADSIAAGIPARIIRKLSAEERKEVRKED